MPPVATEVLRPGFRFHIMVVKIKIDNDGVVNKKASFFRSNVDAT